MEKWISGGLRKTQKKVQDTHPEKENGTSSMGVLAAIL